jgi:uncharacterized Zn-finger protein
MGGRRKNPHPKRAVNVKTVLKGDEKEERGRGEEKEGDEELRLLRMLRCGSCEDDENVVMEQNHHHVPKAFIIPAAKGVKRKRGQHECDVCEKSFRDSNSLKAHMRIHTNEKPYECEVCEMKFRHSGSLKTHMRIHTNEKPYACDVCEKRFSDSSHFTKHMRVHTKEKPYECDVCKKRFRRSCTLKDHMRIHTNERPYECDESA